MIHSVLELYKRYERWIPIGFFLLGFLFDAIVLGRIDEPFVIFQQGLYIILSAAMIAVELIEHERAFESPRVLAKVWPYREALLHFLMGTLLNAYTIFYFKSASALTSFVFTAFMVAVLLMNEFTRFGRFQTRVHVAILSLCVISYCGVLSPLLIGFVGALPFLLANIAALSIAGLYATVLKSKVSTRLISTHVWLPFACIQAMFVLLYFLRVIPPVPLSATYMGIFHDVQKVGHEYRLMYTRPDGKFWQHGDQTFLARPGDVVFCFIRIFAPSRFKDQLQVRWLYRDGKRGWQPADAIPLSIVGGREEGFRGVTKKSNYQPGDWRVQVETTDGREIGRIGFTIVADQGNEPRSEKTIFQ